MISDKPWRVGPTSRATSFLLLAVTLLSLSSSTRAFVLHPRVLSTPCSATTTTTTATTLFGKKAKRKGGAAARRQQPVQEKQSVKDARFDAQTRQYMFSIVGLSKVLPDKSKTILKNINLAFFPGAKIGIVGSNGSGEFVCCSLRLVGLSLMMKSDERLYQYTRQ